MSKLTQLNAGLRSSYVSILLAGVVIWAIFQITDVSPWAYIVFVCVGLLVMVSRFVRGWAAFLSKCFTPILLGILLVMIYIHLYQTTVFLGLDVQSFLGSELGLLEMLKLAQFNESYKEPFYSAISTLYAIIIALALVKGMEDVDALKKVHQTEVQTIRSIWQYLKYFEDQELDEQSQSSINQLRDRLRQYLRMIGLDNLKMADPANRSAIDDCIRHVLNVKPADADDKIVYPEIIHKLNELDAIRAQRLSMNGSSISKYLMTALWAMSIALILPFLAEPLCIKPEEAAKLVAGGELRFSEEIRCQGADDLFLSPQRFSQYYMIFILASFFSFLMFMLHDLSSLDEGFWRVDLEPFEELLAEFNGADGEGMPAGPGNAKEQPHESGLPPG